MDSFFTTLWDYYDQNHRDLPWRTPEPDGTFDPYKILISEVMLQQTQVPRVIAKYHAFLQIFPDVPTLAQASLAEVLRVWSGLGYNRRAKYVWQAANQINQSSQFPHDLAGLTALPGVGKNTAGAILAYAYNQPAVFVETNIRTVLIYHFFSDRHDVTDVEITAILNDILQHPNIRSPREFYWGIMDYGTYLKSVVTNPGRMSKHYTKQSVFKGSKRQVRGQVLRLLGDKPLTKRQIMSLIQDQRLESVLTDLVNENLISYRRKTYQLYTL